MQMGCHGIGVSRMIAAVADTLSDSKGLNWPRVMSPFEVIVVPGKNLDEEAARIYDMLDVGKMDVVLDDRKESFAWKMGDADLVGYPVIVVLGRRWKEEVCEVQCRRLGIKEDVAITNLEAFVQKLLVKL